MQEANTADQYWHGMRKDPDVNLTDAQLAEVHKFWDKYAFAYKNTPRTQAFFLLCPADLIHATAK